jgi:hypothetical protein
MLYNIKRTPWEIQNKIYRIVTWDKNFLKYIKENMPNLILFVHLYNIETGHKCWQPCRQASNTKRTKAACMGVCLLTAQET